MKLSNNNKKELAAYLKKQILINNQLNPIELCKVAATFYSLCLKDKKTYKESLTPLTMKKGKTNGKTIQHDTAAS